MTKNLTPATSTRRLRSANQRGAIKKRRLHAADKALYAANGAGRDRVVVHDAGDAAPTLPDE